MEDGVATIRGLAGGEKIDPLPQDPEALHDVPIGDDPIPLFFLAS
jgi:hypothetical protein